MMQLLVHDPAYTDRLAAFLRSVGQEPVVAGPSAVEITGSDAAEIEVYLSVWHVLHPDVAVELQV
jgi:hypothetical protein